MQDVEPEEDYILVIDADMIMRSPFFPKQLGVSPGMLGDVCPCRKRFSMAVLAGLWPQTTWSPEIAVVLQRLMLRLLLRSRSSSDGTNPQSPVCDTGWAVSAFFGYLKGVQNELALKHVPHVKPRNDSLAGPVGRMSDMVSHPHSSTQM